MNRTNWRRLAISTLALIVSLTTADAAERRDERGRPSPIDTAISAESSAGVSGDTRTTMPAPPNASAVSVAGTSVRLDWYSINYGGVTEAAEGPYRMGVSIGQTAAGFVEEGPYQMGLGFWYGAAPAPECACDCFGDAQCDSVITNVFDAVIVVDVAFRNGTSPVDPNPNCPYWPTDVTCDDVVNIFDAVLVVDVAFRNGDPAALFCDPCAPALSAGLK